MMRKPSADLPAEIEVEIISRLFNALPQVLCVTTGLVVGSLIVSLETGDLWLWAIFGLSLVTSASRIVGVLAFKRYRPAAMTLAQAQRWEYAYAAPALVFTCNIALLTIRSFQIDNTDGIILSIGLTMALTAGSCARTLRYWLCATLSTISLGVLIAALMLTRDPLKMGIGMLFGLYLYSVFESSRHIVSQVEALLIAERRLDAEARRDALTGIANRRAFDEALAASTEAPEPFALLLLDLDGFKAVNDRLGHAAGDELLRQVADRLGGIVRSGDTLARLGGDEFAIVMPGANARAAEAVAGRAVATVGLPYVVFGSPAIVGISVGVEVAGAVADAAAIKAAADRALYAAKAAGKGQAMLAPARAAA